MLLFTYFIIYWFFFLFSFWNTLKGVFSSSQEVYSKLLQFNKHTIVSSSLSLITVFQLLLKFHIHHGLYKVYKWDKKNVKLSIINILFYRLYLPILQLIPNDKILYMYSNTLKSYIPTTSFISILFSFLFIFILFWEHIPTHTL